MSERDENAALTREQAEADIAKIIRFRTDEGLTGKQIAKKVGWNLGRTQAVLARLIKHKVVKPAGAPRGARQMLIDLVDEKYGKGGGRK